MTQRNWKKLLRSLPRGLTFAEVAQRLGTPYQATRLAIIRYKYNAQDGRKYSQRNQRKLNPDQVNWRLSNKEIADQFGVSRERVRKVRERLGKPTVEARGRKPN